MKIIPLEEVEVGMEVSIALPGDTASQFMIVIGVAREKVHGWQEVINVFLTCSEGRRHTLVAGVDDFSKSGNQIFVAV